MTRFFSLVSVTCLALLVAPLTASTVAAAPVTVGEMDARMAAAMDLLDAMGGRAAVTSQIARVIPAQMQELQAQFPRMTSDMRLAIETSMRVEMTKGVNQLLNQMAGAWAQRFSAKDLREIAAFHRSPPGRRLRAEQAELQREISEIGRNWGVEIGRRIQERLKEQVAKPPALTS